MSTPELTVLKTDLPGALSSRSGKVRDIYDYGDGLLIVASDRISAFDVIMANGIPGKGKILTQLSLFWFDLLKGVLPNHLISAEVADFPAPTQAFADILAGRSMWVRKAEVVQVECVVRGYLAGSGWKAYQQTGEILGHKLPAGLRLADKLPEPIFTPAIKAESGHDENISVARMAEIIGQDLAIELEQTSLALFNHASQLASAKGFLLCDTKFEFGLHEGKLILVDEIFTPDSSRWWDAAKYEPGKQQESFDKQYVRDYLEGIGWDKEPPAPELPPDVVAETRRIYEEALRRLTA